MPNWWGVGLRLIGCNPNPPWVGLRFSPNPKKLCARGALVQSDFCTALSGRWPWPRGVPVVQRLADCLKLKSYRKPLCQSHRESHNGALAGLCRWARGCRVLPMAHQSAHGNWPLSGASPGAQKTSFTTQNKQNLPPIVVGFL